MAEKEDPERPKTVEANPVRILFWFCIWVTAVFLAWMRNGKVLNWNMLWAAIFSQIYIIVAGVYFFFKESGFTQIKNMFTKQGKPVIKPVIKKVL